MDLEGRSGPSSSQHLYLAFTSWSCLNLSLGLFEGPADRWHSFERTQPSFSGFKTIIFKQEWPLCVLVCFVLSASNFMPRIFEILIRKKFPHYRAASAAIVGKIRAQKIFLSSDVGLAETSAWLRPDSPGSPSALLWTLRMCRSLHHS